jgi:SNF2 family DNA or RNA helicase
MAKKQKTNNAMAKGQPKTSRQSLRAVKWKRWLRAPDNLLRDELYDPALSRAVRYDRCCAYFTSNVLAVAARGFGGFIENLRTLGQSVPKPSARLLVNEQLNPSDLNALLMTGDQSKLIEKLLKQFKTPKDALERNRLEMLAWMVVSGLLEVRVGLMRSTQGVVHAKFGIIIDGIGESLVFMGSDNETGSALTENYEELELSESWKDADRDRYYRERFETLWEDRDANVIVLSLPEAVRLKLIKLAPKEPPKELTHDKQALGTVMLWQFIASSPYLPNGEQACDATALVELWPHQKRVVEDTARAFPAGRLLCDEVGMGKTIEAILVLRRLLCGRGVKRALLLVPAGLLKQWQDELREKGGLLIPIWDGNLLFWPDGTQEKFGAAEAFAKTSMLLVSREWARLESNREVVLTSPIWDLVLLDEAHAARRATPEEGEFNTGNLLLELLRELQLRRRARGILLMSATPMQTQPFEPWDLLGVLGIGGQWMVDFADIRRYYKGVEELKKGNALTPPLAKPLAQLVATDVEFPPAPSSVQLKNGKISETSLLFVSKGNRSLCSDWLRHGAPLGRRMHRNTRETLKKYYEKGLLPLPPPKREVGDVIFDYESPAERETYEAIEKYINERFDELEREKSGKGFVMTVYRRRMASSPLALRRSLDRRQAKLERFINKHWTAQALNPGEEGVDTRDLSDANLDERIDPALPSNPSTARDEKGLIRKLLTKLEALGPTDSKYDKFQKELKEITADGRSALVFTEYTDTMEYLRDLLTPTYGSTLGCYSGDGGQLYHGGQWIKVSKAHITEKLADKELQILLCTDAASEGLNLQAASALINYDLPWNPSKVEQRIGRVDRIGQRQPVVPIRNLFLRDSVDMRVYQALRMRCGLFEHFVGKMQPVLAFAREALRKNLRPKDTQSFIRELNHAADGVDADAAFSNAFSESDAEKLDAPEPPVTRRDLETAIGWLEQGCNAVKARKVKAQASWRLSGIGRRTIEVTVDRETLERDERIAPITVGTELMQRLVERLGSPTRLPLVIVELHSGNFRCTEARWIDGDTIAVLKSAAQLQKFLEAWDGALPTPTRFIEAQDAARRAARRRLEQMKQAAQTAEAMNLRNQIEAARSRLLKELGRTLRCIGSGDLNAVLRKQIERESHSDERYHRAIELLGGYPAWTAALLEDSESFFSDRTAHERQARVALPAPLDAALNDPRWKAGAAVRSVSQ